LQVEFLVGREIEVGRTYKGIISSIKEYGAFVEFNGGQHGLLHISELSHEPVFLLNFCFTLLCCLMDQYEIVKQLYKTGLGHLQRPDPNGYRTSVLVLF
jgi:polyribonucleotide nucleotidyltransferase